MGSQTDNEVLAMQVNYHSVDTVATLERLMNEKPYTIEPHGTEPKQVDVLDIQFDVISTFRDTEMSYVAEQRAESDGIPVAHLESIVTKPTSVFAFDAGSFVVSMFDHEVDAYPIFERVFKQFGLSTSRSGNDFLINEKKILGVANFETDAWACGGQLRPLSFDPSPYIDLPDEKFVDKDTNNFQQRVGSIDEFTPDNFTPAARHAKEALEAVLNDKPINFN